MTVVTIRPDATTATVGSISITGGASAAAVLADSSDSSYIYNVHSSDSVTMSLGDFTLPAGAVVKRIALRARVANFDDD